MKLNTSLKRRGKQTRPQVHILGEMNAGKLRPFSHFPRTVDGFDLKNSQLHALKRGEGGPRGGEASFLTILSQFPT